MQLESENNTLKTELLLAKEEIQNLKVRRQLFLEEKCNKSSSIEKFVDTDDMPLQADPSCSISKTQGVVFGDLLNKRDEKKSKEKERIKIKKQKKKKSKTSKRKVKKQKKGSEEDYDSDNYKGLSDKENLSIWIDNVDGVPVKMIHLTYGISIKYIAWKKLKKIKSASLFVRNLSRAIWGVYALMNRALSVDKCQANRLSDCSPRKPLTPVKKAVLKKCYSAYLDLNHKAQKNKLKNKWKRFLGIYINYLINTELDKLKNKSDSCSSTSSNGTQESSSSSDSNSSDSD